MPLPFPNAGLESGIIVGHVSDCTARIWLRLPRVESHVVTLRGRDGATWGTEVVPDPERDFTTVVDVQGLAPDTEYAIDVRAAGGARVFDRSLAPRVRTFPSPGSVDRLCFGLVSCNQPYEAGPDGDVRVGATAAVLGELCEALEQHDARFVLAVGDQVYVDAVPATDIWARAANTVPSRWPRALPELYREVYRGFWGLPEIQKVHARFANYMVWDDHDIRDNWGSLPPPGGSAGELHAAMWRAARRAYEEYQHAHNPPTSAGTYHYAFDVGTVAFFVLDLRGQRDCMRSELLGAAQWAAFEAWVHATASRPARFVVSSVPVQHVPDRLVAAATKLPDPLRSRLPEPLFDRWCAASFEADLARFLDLLLTQPPEATPVTILAGDIHIATAGEFHGRVEGAVRQWVSSPLTNKIGLRSKLESQFASRSTNLAARWPLRHFFHEDRNNFALVELTPDGAGGYVTEFHVHVWDGHRARRAYTVRYGPGAGGGMLTRG